MATEFDCSRSLIQRRLKEARGLPPTLPLPPYLRRERQAHERPDITHEGIVEARKRGLRFQQLADQLECTTGLLHARLRTKGRTESKNRKRPDITVDRIIALMEAGLTRQDVAAALDCTVGTVRRHLLIAGYACRPQKVVRPDITIEAIQEAQRVGLSLRQVADKFKCSYDLLSRRLREAQPVRDAIPVHVARQRHEHERPDVTVETILEARSRGLTFGQVACELKCSKQLLYRRLKTTGAVAVV